MKNKTTVLESITSKVIPILKKNKISRAGVFGSYAQGKPKKDSDIDILIEFNGSLLTLVRIERELQKALKRKVDLLTYKGINHHLRDKILSEEIRII